MARAFAVNVPELVVELETRQALLASDIGRLRVRLLALPWDCRERRRVVQEMARVGASFGELQSLHDLISGKDSE